MMANHLYRHYFAVHILLLFILVRVYRAAKSYENLFPDMPTHMLQRHIKISRHQPFCVIFKTSGVGSKLEMVTYTLWKNNQSDDNYRTWVIGAFSPEKEKMPPNNDKPEKIPAIRCYLGETSSYQYQGKVTKMAVRDWLTKLANLYREQSEELTLDLFKATQKLYDIILLAFPDGPQHHEVEDMIYWVAAQLDSCRAMAVHLTSPLVLFLRQKYGVNKYPSVVVIHNKVSNMSVSEDFQVFSGRDVNSHVIKVYITAYSMAAPLLTLEAFENMFHQNDSVQKFKPILVCFYAHWATNVLGYLNAYNDTINTYLQDNVYVKFGLIDLVKDASKKVVSRYLQSGAMKYIPFLVLFYEDSDGALVNRVLHVGRPYPWNIYTAIHNLGQGLSKLTGIRQYQQPWGSIDYYQFCSLNEGPYGTQCVPWSHNLTDNTPFNKISTMKKIILTKTIVKHGNTEERTWHDKFDTDYIEKQLEVYEGLPLVTLDTWSDVIEKSHAPRHIFYKSGKWAGEVTKVSLVVYIMSDCGNCKRNTRTMREIQTGVMHIDGGAMYYVNCTAEPVLCRNHNIRGFPTITAFRGLGWMDTSSCLTTTSQNIFKKFVRMDYHGIIKANLVLDWFSRISDNAVHNVEVDGHFDYSFTEKDISLIARVTPTCNVNVTGENDNLQVYWHFNCLRLLCERLYSIVDCYSISSSTRTVECQYHHSEIVVGVIQLSLSRRDGVNATLIQHGHTLHSTLENPSNMLLHKFHKAHSYTLNSEQTCETNPAECTDIVTEFILDHSRLPVTKLTSDMFHTSTSMLKEKELPILIAFAHPDNLTEASKFYKVLTEVAYYFYDDIIVMTVDVNQYPAWTSQFVPSLYGHTRVWKSDKPDPLSLFVYPRLCIILTHDHLHAAFYPPITRQRQELEEFNVEIITDFIHEYLKDPNSLIIETEKF